jgi:hypothetical protein
MERGPLPSQWLERAGLATCPSHQATGTSYDFVPQQRGPFGQRCHRRHHRSGGDTFVGHADFLDPAQIIIGTRSRIVRVTMLTELLVMTTGGIEKKRPPRQATGRLRYYPVSRRRSVNCDLVLERLRHSVHRWSILPRYLRPPASAQKSNGATRTQDN